MVTGEYIKCEMCDTVFKFRLQLDHSIYSYELPISIKCPTCGNTFDCRFNHKLGVMPKQYKTEPVTQADYSVAYSPQLPIPANLYYQEQEIISLTPYMEITRYYDMRLVHAFGKYLQLLLDEFYPQRELFSKCYPILQKGNIQAFQKMMQKLCDIKNPTRSLTDLEECFSAYHDFYVSAWEYFAVNTYCNHIGRTFEKMVVAVKTMPVEQLRSLYDTLNSRYSISKWRWDAWKNFACYADHIEFYFPAMFHLYMGDFRLPHTPKLCIVTLSQTKSNENYSKAYTRLVEILPFLVGLLNWKETGDADKFPNADSGMKGITGIDNYACIAEGLRIEKLDGYDEMQNYLLDCLDSHKRNAIDHHHVEMDSLTQQLKYYYRPGDDSLYDTGMLIDECYMTHICMIHIIEAVLLVDEVKKRLQ